MELIGNYIKGQPIEKKITESAKKCQYCGKPYKKIVATYAIAGVKQEPKIFVEPNCDCSERIQKELLAKQEKEKVEKIFREEKEKRFILANIPPIYKRCTFENFSNDVNCVEERRRCLDFVNSFDRTKSNGISMIGNVGTGKTSLLAMCCNELLERGYKCYFTTFSDLLDECAKYSFDNGGDAKSYILDLTKYDFIVLDDVGKNQTNITEKRKELFFKIVNTLLCYQVVTAFTANPDDIGQLRLIPGLQATLDRLRGMCKNVFNFKGKSLR